MLLESPLTREQRVNTSRWIKALRSGKYKQGHYQLKTHDNEFCCLGVACDISGVSEWKEVSCSPSGFMATSLSYDGATYCLSGRILKMYGIHAGSDSPIHHLVEMNDTLRYTFLEIAEVLEDMLIADKVIFSPTL